MARQIINTGTLALNGRDGDTNRDAADKSNANFAELYAADASFVKGPASAANGAIAVFSGTTGKVLSSVPATTFEPAQGTGTAAQYRNGLKALVDFAASVRASALTGLSLAASTVVSATDTVLSAIGKLQAQVTLRAPLASPDLTGAPTAPTPSASDASTRLQTTEGSLAQVRSFGLGTPGTLTPDYLITPGNNGNTSPTRFIVALGSEDQATAQQPEAGTAFSGIHIARGVRPAQMGVSGAGANAKLFFRGYASASATLADWRQAASSSDQSFSGPIRPGQYTLTTLPNASSFSGYEIDVTNATGGSKRCRSNGTVWQILNTTTTVS